jgi:hypothetical protein
VAQEALEPLIEEMAAALGHQTRTPDGHPDLEGKKQSGHRETQMNTDSANQLTYTKLVFWCERQQDVARHAAIARVA